MVNGFLLSCGNPGFSGYYDLIEGENRNPTCIWDPAPARRGSLCDQSFIFILFFKEENFNLEQKKATLG